MIILGIDPGYAIVGYGVVSYDNRTFTPITYGAVTTEAGLDADLRLEQVYDGISAVIDRYQPDAIAIEQLFFTNNKTTGIMVAQARGVILLAARKKGVPTYEYTPMQVKQSVVGYGNAVKKQGRESLKTIAEKEEQIASLEADKARLEGEVANLKSEITSLEEEKATLQADLDKANEELETAKAEIAKLKETLEKIVTTGKGASADGSTAVVNVTAGVKGTIARVDNEYNFCLVTLTDEALMELIGENGDRELPELEYLVRRPGDENGIVGKIRLRTLTKDTKTIVCDILAGWKQAEFQKGDEVFYLD